MRRDNLGWRRSAAVQSVVLSACIVVPRLLVAVEGPVWKLATVRDAAEAASILFECLK